MEPTGENGGAASQGDGSNGLSGINYGSLGSSNGDDGGNKKDIRVDAVARWRESLKDVQDASDYVIESVLSQVPVEKILKPTLKRTAISAMSSRENITDNDVIYIWSRGPAFTNVRDATLPLDEILNEATSRWEFIGAAPEYTPVLDDLMSVMKVEAIRKVDGNRVQQKIFRVLPIPPSEAPQRKMIPANPQVPDVPNVIGTPIRVMTYNILCKSYADFKQYPYTPQFALEWDYRKRSLINEMTKQYASDIICLQECEKSDFEETFKPALSEAGFTGDFQKRPGVKQDGCAIFFKSDKFKLAESHCIQFDVLENDPLIKPVKRTYTFRTNNIASLVLLERLDHGDEQILDTQRFFWVISAHLFWNPSVPTVKLLQAKFLLDETRRIQAAWQKRRLSQSAPTSRFDAPPRLHNDIGVSDISSPLLSQTRYVGPHMPVIFCGDLNSTPDSAVYAIIKNGSVPKADLAARKFPLIDWQQPFRTLKSAYEHHGEPMTNITENFSGCLDYIWFDSTNVAVTKVLQNPTQDTTCSANIQEYGFLPSPTHPSDHIPLVAEFTFIKPQ